MKKVLVTGKSSYIGRSFAEAAKGRMEVEAISLRGGVPGGADFSGFDAVLHCAGIAHVSGSRGQKGRGLYMAANCGLAVEAAKKAKEGGARQFVFMSSMLVYGGGRGIFDIGDEPRPRGAYAESKLRAEEGLAGLAGDGFKLAVVRCPMVYGPGCKGNFPLLARLARLAPVFPQTGNRRSMVYVGNLCAFLLDIVEGEKSGLFLPQNSEWVNTADLVAAIRQAQGRRTLFTGLFNLPLRALAGAVPAAGKLFGDFACRHSAGSAPPGEVGFYESVAASLGCALPKNPSLR